MYGERLSELLAGVYDAPLMADGWTSLIPALEDRLNGRVALFIQRPHTVATIAHCSAASAQMVAQYEDRLWPEDRAMRALRMAPPGEIICDSVLISDRDRESSAFYGRYLADNGLGRGIYASVAKEGNETFVVSVQRSRSAGHYGSNEIGLLRRLTPHLDRSFRIWRQVRDLQLERDAALEVAKAHGASLPWVECDAKPRFANENAQTDELGFTPAETRLLKALVSGQRIDEYAARTGVAVSTVKSHLRALFDKTGERRQIDLVRRAVLDRWCSVD